MAYCISGVVFYLKSTPASLERPIRDRYGNRQNRDFRQLLPLKIERPTARLKGP